MAAAGTVSHAASPLRRGCSLPTAIVGPYRSCVGVRPIASEVAMREAWELLIVGPPDAERSVLLLPGGANAARSFDLVMAEPALSGVRLVATTLPGMAGAPVSTDPSVP